MKTCISRNITDDQSSAEFSVILLLCHWFSASIDSRDALKQLFKIHQQIAESYPSKFLRDTPILIRIYANQSDSVLCQRLKQQFCFHIQGQFAMQQLKRSCLLHGANTAIQAASQIRELIRLRNNSARQKSHF